MLALGLDANISSCLTTRPGRKSAGRFRATMWQKRGGLWVLQRCTIPRVPSLFMDAHATGFRVRPFGGHDYPRYVDVVNACFPDRRWTVGDAVQNDRLVSADSVARLAIEDAHGRTVGFGRVDRRASAASFSIEILVDPANRRRGAGTALYERLLQTVAPMPQITIICMVLESDVASVRFAAQRGFDEFRRNIEWRRRADAPMRSEAAPRGTYRIETVRDVGRVRDDVRREVTAFISTWVRDTPSPEPWTDATSRTFSRQCVEAPGFLDDASLVAIERGKIVGVASASRSLGEDGVMFVDFVGVAQANRRNGLAAALLTHLIRYALASQYAEIRVWTDGLNSAVVGLLERLDFRRYAVWLTLGQRVEGGTGPIPKPQMGKW